MSRALALLPLLTAASLHAQTVQPVQPVQNGSFENPGVNGQTAGAGDNWTITGNPFVLSNNAGLGTTTYGNQWERLNAGSTIAQTLTVPAILGQVYTLSLVAADIYGQAEQLTLSVSGAATASQAFAIPARPGGFSNGALPLVAYNLSYTATAAGNVTITLANTGGSNGLALDNVQVNASVPEPSTWALLGLGVAGLGLALRRRVRCALAPIRPGAPAPLASCQRSGFILQGAVPRIRAADEQASCQTQLFTTVQVSIRKHVRS